MNITTPKRQVKEAANDGGHSMFSWLKAHTEQISEWFWFSVSFVLFVALGPFSAIAVLFGLKALASEERQQDMVEPARV